MAWHRLLWTYYTCVPFVWSIYEINEYVVQHSHIVPHLMTFAFARIIVSPSAEFKASQASKLSEKEESLWLGRRGGKTGQTLHKSSPISRRLIARGSPFADIHLRSPSLANPPRVIDSAANPPDNSLVSHTSTGVTTTPVVSTVKVTNPPVRKSSKTTTQTLNQTPGLESTTGEELKTRVDPRLDRENPKKHEKQEKPAQSSAVAATREKASTTHPQAPTKNTSGSSASSSSSPSKQVVVSASSSPTESPSTPPSTPGNNRSVHGSMPSKDIAIIVVSCLAVIGCGIYLLIRKLEQRQRQSETIRCGRLTPPPSGISNHSKTPWMELGPETSDLSPAALEGGLLHPAFTSDGKDKALDGKTTVPDQAYLQAQPNLQRRILRRLAGISAATSSAAGVAGGRVLESFVRRQVRDDAEARLDGTQGTHSTDKLSMDEKAAKAQAETGYVHPLGSFATLHNWGSESQYWKK